MAKNLKRLYRLREMAINVPEADVPAFRKAIQTAIKAGQLPPSATAWAGMDKPTSPTPAAPVAGAKAKGTTPPPVPAAAKAKSADAGGSSLGGWAAWKDKNPGVNPAKSSTPDLDDPWFQDDQPTQKAKATPPPTPKAKPAKANKGIDWAADTGGDDFPDLPAPQSANQDVTNSDDYKSPFAGAGLGSGGSSWDNLPAYLRDPEQMPRAGGGSQRIPRSAEIGADDDVGEPGKPPKKKGPAAVGAPWSAKDAGEKKPGMLSRLFGKKGSK